MPVLLQIAFLSGSDSSIRKLQDALRRSDNELAELRGELAATKGEAAAARTQAEVGTEEEPRGGGGVRSGGAIWASG